MIPQTNLKHVPVLSNEVLSFLDIKPAGKYLDGTCGLGGHSEQILSKLSQSGFLIGTDIDSEAISIAKTKLKKVSGNFHIEKCSYSQFPKVLKKLNIDKVDGVLLDLGLSSLQLDSKDRGFSFMRDASLDMRFDLESKIKANDIINRFSEVGLADIMYHFGEERMSRKISKNIIKNRPINMVSELVEIIRISTPPNKRNKTMARVFQSFRIAVNNEIDNLKKFLKKYIPYIKVGGKNVIISFHSIEDRIVKHSFKSSGNKGVLKILTKKPIMASEEEKNFNKRSKSAKLRCAIKL
jgi:16S rRNA (cytosine1402-N4)-methyltransferase